MKVILPLLLFTFNSFSLELTQSKRDGCTLFFDRGIKRDWSECCLKHDIRYFFGGSKKMRYKVDQKLKSCVLKKAGPVWSFILHSGVIVGHLSPIKSKYAWNASWNNSREHFIDSFSKEEKDLIYHRMFEGLGEPSVWLPLYNELKNRSR